MRIIPINSAGGYEGETQRIIGGITGVAALRVVHSQVSDDMTALNVTDVLNVTEAGKLLGIGMVCHGAVSGVPETDFEVEIDGETLTSFSVYNATFVWDRLGAQTWQYAGTGTGGGSALGNAFWIPLASRYATSCRVSHNISVVAAGGTVILHALRGIEL